MKKAFFAAFFSLVCICVCFGQNDLKVISSSGEHLVSSEAQLTYTLGETFTGGSVELSQGFHQSNLQIIETTVLDASISVNIYPNPVVDVLHLNFKEEYKDLSVRVLSMSGSKVYESHVSGKNIESLNMSDHGAGTYLLQVMRNGKIVKTLKIAKIN